MEHSPTRPDSPPNDLLTTLDVMRITGKSRSAVSRIARLKKLGRMLGQMRTFTNKDVTVIRKVRPGNPNWVPGAPQPHRRKIK